MAPNPTYQFAVAALFVKNNLPDTVVGNETYQTLWRSGTDVFNVKRVYILWGYAIGWETSQCLIFCRANIRSPM